MRKDLGVEGLGDLVKRPFVATLATYRRDGSVLLSPVWHEWAGGGFNVIANADDVKTRHIRNDPRASLVLYDNDPPYRGVEIRTTPRIIVDGAHDVLRRIAIRYLGKERGEAYASTPSGEEIVIRLEPGDLRTWDFADDEF
ncbi:MAG: TIGR03618 family F420-dependent PPOX class oxidoreductase [Actinomycetota bacterium]|nr:TIGR03618 family F420-dependent PPOX class oxidoreductase [Actinomycetota bacterium]